MRWSTLLFHPGISKSREAHNVVGSLVNVVFWVVVAYCHYGSIIHRSTWDSQHINLTFFFLLVPEMFLCQIVIDIIPLIRRYYMKGSPQLQYTDSFGSHCAHGASI